MTAAIVFVEEASAKVVVETLARRLLPQRHVVVVHHEGKSDLKKSFPRKISSWRHPVDVPFIILHDNDGGNCRALKTNLRSLVPSDRSKRTQIRIVMQCLECWYLADPVALAKAELIKTTKAEEMNRAAKFRSPDRINNAKDEFLRLHKQAGQIGLARAIAPNLDLDNAKSPSFALFVKTLKALA